MHRSRNDEERRRLLERLRAEFFLPPLLEHKYRLEEVIGEGSYGVVCSAVNTETGQRVAVKRIMRVFEEVPEAMRTLRELKFLRLLKNHENIITIHDVLLPSDRENFDDVFLVLELMPTDLTRVLRSRIELSPEHIRWLVFQLTRGIFYMHTCRVFHRDLKPSNILINAHCDLRIVDFGLSRAAFDNQDPDFVFWTDYVATRWYRAPELIMSTSSNYTTAIDMWSIGCIFAEMLNNGRPMFPGHNPEDQLQQIINFCGSPSPEATASVREPRARALLARMPQRQPGSLSQTFPNAEPLALDLLAKMLEFNPDNRISAEEALQHPYLQMDSVVRGTPIDIAEFAFERQNVSISDLRTLFLEEILQYHPDRRHMYLAPADQPRLQYQPVDQASRFREAMVATRNGMEPPRAWDSMPNQTLTHYYERATGNNSVHSQAGSVVQPNGDEDARMTASTVTNGQSRDGGGGNGNGGNGGGNGAGANQSGQAQAQQQQQGQQRPPQRPNEGGNVTVRTTGIGGVGEDDRRGGGGGGGDNGMQAEGGNEEAMLMRYAGLSSVESASSAMNFRHDSGAMYGGVASRRQSETLDSMMETAPEAVADGGNERMAA